MEYEDAVRIHKVIGFWTQKSLCGYLFLIYKVLDPKWEPNILLLLDFYFGVEYVSIGDKRIANFQAAYMHDPFSSFYASKLSREML